ncbi:site-specific DNA-methyltransferase [Xenorhabdus cabanillasii]|nr:site-specific DNA-methyltransferase [Xenorhabdus cabanillasii]PHM76099.1 type II DNA modification methyltransferase [Xenorhabdus cabanillasii JM26]
MTIEKITLNYPESKSADITQKNIDQLKQLFPEIFSEGKIDFDALKAVLGEIVDDSDERYNFTWHGKARARQIAQTPSTGTLRPCKEESVNWDTTKNLFIEGDNLEVLKLLQKSYHKKVKMIYIDPPYNTGKDFVYKDNFHNSIKNYLEQTGQIDSEGNKLSTNSGTSGRYHSDWLSMTYSRLKLARNLLSEDGAIFISIDENESANLESLCKEIFGEDNFIGELIWIKKFSPQNDANYFSLNHESILCFAKSKPNFRRNLLPMTEEQINRYTNLDNDPRGVWQSDNLTVATYNELYDYAIKTPSGRIVNPVEGRCWAVPKNRFEQLVKEDRVWFGKDGRNVPRLKRFLSETKQGRVPISILHYDEVGHTQSASQELKQLFSNKKYFDFPKPVRLIEYLISIVTDKDDVVLDFFAGSGTTAHALLNKNKQGNRI